MPAFKRILGVLISVLLLFTTAIPVYAETFVPSADFCCTCCGNTETLVYVCTGERAPQTYKDFASIVDASPFTYIALDSSAGKCIGMAICAKKYYCRTYSVCNHCGWYQQVLQFHLCGADGCDLIHCSLEDMQEYCREAESIGIDDLRHNMYTKDGYARVSRLYETGALPLVEFADWLENKK